MNITISAERIPEKPEEIKAKLSLQMMVEVRIIGEPYYGVVKWMGSLEVNGKMEDLVGLEMVI